uniref:Insulin-like domain-containing protein n=1 Tax=Timema monikensis TaxID=170555 RepID=A0A7R9E8A3_9NEOP|nr:unnamed protein product [Timema monikensis]
MASLVLTDISQLTSDSLNLEATLDDWPESPIIEEPPRFPFRTRSNSASFQPVESSRRSRRGIVDECCAKSCTLEVIQSYCGAR